MIFDVVCFGALNIDKLYNVNRIANVDEESVISNLQESPGGSAANTAVGLARLGIKTGFIGKVANDREGEFSLKSLTNEKVNTDGIVIANQGRSGVVIGFVDTEGQRALYVDPGVNNTLSFKEMNINYAANTKFLHLTSFAGNIPFEAQIALIQKTSNAKVTIDPGTIYARKGWKKLEPLIAKCYAFLPNEHELRLLTGKDYRKGSEILLRKGMKIVAVKLGKKGSYVTDGKEHHLIEPYEVKVVDSTGAGDAFCAGFLYGLVRNKGLRECGLLGNFVASKSLTKMGARDGLPKDEELPL